MFDFLYEEIRVEFAGIKFEGDLMGVLLIVSLLLMLIGTAVLISALLFAKGVNPYVNGAVSWVGAMLITYSFMKWCAR